MQTPELLPHQPEGVDFLTVENPKFPLPHRILAFDMGLGKTYIGAASAAKVGARRGLVVCPLSVVDDWYKALIIFKAVPRERLYIVKNTTDKIPDSVWWIIVTKDLIVYPEIHAQVAARWYDACLIDEIHYLKSMDSKLSRIMLDGYDELPPVSGRAYWKWGFSGTPMPNRPIELYPILKAWAEPLIRPYETFDKFGVHFCNGFVDATGEKNYSQASNVDELREKTKAFIKFKKYDDVFPDTPEAVIEPVYLDIPFEEIGGDDSDTHLATLRNIVGVAKIPYIVQHVIGRIEANPDEKLLIFAYSRAVIEGLAEQLAHLGAMKYYGGMSKKAKDVSKHWFIKNPKCKILIVQINSGGTGIDGIQKTCNNTIHAEVDWVPGGYSQQISRLRRYKQEKTVFVTVFVAGGTLDERIVGRREQKQKAIDVLEDTHNKPKKEKSKMLSIDEDIKAIRMDVANLVSLVNKLVGNVQSPAKVAPPAAEAPATVAQTTAVVTPPTAASASDAAGGAAAENITAETVRDLAVEYIKSFGDSADGKAAGTAACKEILKPFKVEKVADLKGKQIKKAHELFSSALAAKAAPAAEAPVSDEFGI